MVRITNEHLIDLPLSVWLLQDGYNSGASEAPEGELISVTTLMKPTRQLILKRKVDMSKETLDVSDLIASRMGHGLHDSIERAWTQGNWKQAMRKLHYPEKIINSIVINPDPDTVIEGQIPIYLEKRGFKQFDNMVITGQLDFLIDKSYRDFKSTSTFSYTSGSKDKDFILQGSLYRWIMPHLIKDDIMRIEFIFTDWAKYRAKSDPNYPQTRVTHKEFKLLSLKETEEWVLNKLDNIRYNSKKSQKDMVRCTDTELWRQKNVFKYYSNPETAKANGRCTKKFNLASEAQLHKQAKGKGVVMKQSGEVKACEYCPAYSICEQRREYFND